MKKAAVLIVGVLVYVWFLQTGQDAAKGELAQLKNLYTLPDSQVQTILSSNR